jgi:hypothetical protein
LRPPPKKDFTVAADLAAKEERALDEALRARGVETVVAQQPSRDGGGVEAGGSGGGARTR